MHDYLHKIGNVILFIEVKLTGWFWLVRLVSCNLLIDLGHESIQWISLLSTQSRVRFSSGYNKVSIRLTERRGLHIALPLPSLAAGLSPLAPTRTRIYELVAPARFPSMTQFDDTQARSLFSAGSVLLVTNWQGTRTLDRTRSAKVLQSS